MVVDKFGIQINIDDVISYPQRKGGKMWMTDVIVIGFDNGKVVGRERGTKNGNKFRTGNTHDIIRVGRASDLAGLAQPTETGKVATERLDKFGRPIEIGDVVSYPLRVGAKMWMTNAKVLSFKEGRLQVLNRDNGKKTFTKNIQNVIRVGRESDLQERAA